MAQRYQSRLAQAQPVQDNRPQLFRSLADRISAFASRESNEIDKRVAKKAKEQGFADNQGKTNVTLTDGTTIADEARNVGAIAAFTSATNLDIAENLPRIYAENPDPEEFKAVANRYGAGLTEGLDERLKPAVQDALASSILKYSLKAEAERRTREREEQASIIEAGLIESSNMAISDASEGDTDGMLQNVQRSMDSIDSLEEGGFITRPQANKRRKDLNNNTDKAVVMGQFSIARKNGKANDFLSDFTHNPPKYLDLDQATSYSALMEKTIARDARIEKRELAEELADIAREKGKQGSDLAISVSRGEASEIDIEDAYQNRVISADKRTSLIKELDKQTTKANEKADYLAIVSGAINANTPLSSRNKDHRNAVEAYYTENIDDPFSDEGINETVDLINSTTIIPKTVQEFVQSYSKSGNPEQAVQAAEMIARINEKTPQALSSVPADVKAFSLLVSKDVSAGMNPEQAVELSRLSVYGTSEEEKKAFSDAFKTNTKNYREDNRSYLNNKIDDDFDPTFFDAQPKTPLAMEAEFNLMVEQYLPLTKDLGKAKELAYTDLKNVWSRTEINGYPEMTKYAPESYYGEGEWMRNQLISDAKEQLNTTDEINPQIVVDPRTAREANPSYFVVVLDEDGAPNPILNENNQPMRWMPDYSSSKEAKAQQKELNEMLNAAKTEREQRNEPLPERPAIMRDLQGEPTEMTGTM